MRLLPANSISVAVAALACVPAAAEAHLPSPWTRTVESANGKFVLVLLTPVRDRAERREASDYDPQYDQDLTQEQLREWVERVTQEKVIEAKYPQSGVYRNDGSIEPLWLVPYFSACRNVFVSNDGQHVVTAKDMGSTCWDDDDDFLVLYESGKKIAGYDDRLVLPCFWLRAVLLGWLHVYFPYDESSGLDDSAGEFHIETNQGDVLAFDLATGERRVRRSPWPYYFGAPVVFVPIGLWACRRMLQGKACVAAGAGNLGFSLRDIFIVMTLVAGAITAVKLWGWFGGGCAIVAIVGALAARLRSGRASGWIIGAIAALYGGYSLLILSALLDSVLLSGYTLLGFWFDHGWKLAAPLIVLLGVTVAAGWLAGRWCGPRLEDVPK